MAAIGYLSNGVKVNPQLSTILEIHLKFMGIWLASKFMLFFLSLFFFALGLFFFYFVARLYILECTRGIDTIISGRIIRKGIFFYEEEQITAGEILRAELDSTLYDDESSLSSKSYRVNIVLLSRVTFMTFWHTPSSHRKMKKVEQINRFIRSPSEQYILITEDWRSAGYTIGALLLIIAVIILVNMVQIA
jgi:hypothetical protein